MTREEIREWLAEWMADQLGMSPDDMEMDRTLGSYGLEADQLECLASDIEEYFDEQLEENAVVASRETALTADERDRIERRLAELSELKKLYCTGCGYCMPCEHGVKIPQNFDAMNLHRVYGLTGRAKQQYDRLKEGQAAHCTECGECEPKCPQKIEIRRQLREVAETLR